MLYKRIFNFISVCKILSEIKTNRQIQYFATVLFHSLARYGGNPVFFISPTLRWCGVCCWRCWIVVVLFYHLNSISCKRKQTANDSKGFELSEYVYVCVHVCALCMICVNARRNIKNVNIEQCDNKPYYCDMNSISIF